jgi:hypothetical protein
MKKTAVLTIAFLVLGSCLFLQSRAATRSPKVRVAAIQAKLFYEDTGTFSPNVINNPKYQKFWNGRDATAAAFTSALVTAKIVGKPGYVAANAQVRVVATSEGKILLDKKLPVTMLSDKGVSYVGFWIYDCPWRPLHLRAEIVGSPAKYAVQATILFNGGE